MSRLDSAERVTMAITLSVPKTESAVALRLCPWRALDTASRWALGTQNLVQLTRLDLLHAKDNRASCRVAEKCGYLLRDLLPAAPPALPDSGHRHVRTPSGS